LTVSSHKPFRINKFLTKKQKQNDSIPQWIQMETDNKIRYNSKRRQWRKINLGLQGIPHEMLYHVFMLYHGPDQLSMSS
ncbi:large ribosomal subunit protein eL39-like, partial [Urocitellus parryii]